MKPYLKTISLVLLIGLSVFVSGCRDTARPASAPVKQADALAEKMLGDTAASPTDAGIDNSVSMLVTLQVLVDQTLLDPNNKNKIEPIGYFSAKLDSMAMVLSSRLFGVTDPQQSIEVLRNAVFKEWQVTYSDDENDLRNIFPHHVLKRRTGSCLGVSLLVYLLAEKLGLPVYGVLAPGHFFVRFDNGKYRCNIESTKRGACIDDSVYTARFDLPQGSWYSLRNLKPREVAAVVQFAVGNSLRENGAFTPALRCYAWAAEGLHGYAEVWGNMGVVYDTLGMLDKALNAFSKAKALRSDLPNINRNLGTIYLKSQNYVEAIAEYQAGLVLDSTDLDLHFGLGCACYYKNDLERAESELLGVIENRPEAKGAAILLAELYEKKGDLKLAGRYKSMAQ